MSVTPTLGIGVDVGALIKDPISESFVFRIKNDYGEP